MDGVETILEAVRAHGLDFAAYKKLGFIRADVHENGELMLFNYTDKATYEGNWNAVERACRGLIVHWPTATLVARPFEKFFNLNERPETQLEALPSGPCEITAKLDGSLGILYRWQGQYFLATRGNFKSEQAIWGTRYLNEHYKLAGLDDDITLLFEIVYPENRVIVNYNETEALYLIGARRFDGYDLSYAELKVLADRFGLPLVPIEEVSGLDELVPLAYTRTGIEGWVVRFSNGLRVKVKTLEYIQYARIINGLTPQRVRETLIMGEENWQAFMQGLPEEFHAETTLLADAIRAEAEKERARLLPIYEQLAPLVREAADQREGRRTFAQTVMSQHKSDSTYLFALLDGRDITPLLLKNVDVTTLPDNVKPRERDLGG